MLLFLLFFLSFAKVSVAAQKSFQNFDPSKLTEVAPPIIGHYPSYQQFSKDNLPKLPIAVEAVNAMPQKAQQQIQSLSQDEINKINQQYGEKKTEVVQQVENKITDKVEQKVDDAISKNIPQTTSVSTQNVNSPNYHVPNIISYSQQQQSNNQAPNVNNLDIIGSDGSLPMPKNEPAPALPPIPLETIMKPVITKNTTRKVPKKKTIIYTKTEKQKKAEKYSLPELSLKSGENIGWKRQIMPPNIAQKIYIAPNKHLVPVVFQSEIDSLVFKYTINENDNNILRSLLNKVTSINLQDQDGNSLIMHSVYNCNHDALVMLLQKGANPNIANDVGFKPLHLAANMGDSASVGILLAYGAEINSLDNTGSTAIMYAAATDSLNSVKYLLSYGSNLDIVNSQNMTVADFVKSSTSAEMIDFFKTILSSVE